MTTTARLTRCLTNVQARRTEREVTRMLKETAQDLGMDPKELRVEAEQLVAHFTAIGARTRAEQLEVVAEELGMTVAEIDAELRATARARRL